MSQQQKGLRSPSTLKRLFFSAVLLLSVGSYGCAQTRPAITIDSNNTSANNKLLLIDSSRLIPGNFLSFETDRLNNVYLLTKQSHQLKKITDKGDSCCVFNDVRRYGNPTTVNVSNPLKPVVFYRDYNTVVMLDRFLSHRNTIDLRMLNIFDASAITVSYDNNLWVFDAQAMKLKKINDNGELLFETADIRQLINEAPEPAAIFDSENYVYLYDANKGFYIFDYYGAFVKSLPFKNWQNVQVIGHTLMGIESGRLNLYQDRSMKLETFAIPATYQNKKLQMVNGQVYALTDLGLVISPVN